MCLRPLKAWWSKAFNSKGVRHLHFTPPSDVESFFRDYIPLPCGKCLGCLDDRRKRWVNRLMLEHDSQAFGSFITLTYSDKYVPSKPLKIHFQKFLKRFRNIPRDLGLSPLPDSFKYFACGESGGLRGRPHYHALLFGVDLLSPEWEPYIATYDDKGNPVFSSKVLEKKWPFGFCTVSDITPGRCKYIAKYTMKQVGQENSFTLKSPRLGIHDFFIARRCGRKLNYSYRYSDSLQRLIDGNIHISTDRSDLQNIRIPPSILRYLERIDPSSYEDIKLYRQLDAIQFANKKFDKDAYVARLVSEEKKQKLKRKLHNEKTCLLDS